MWKILLKANNHISANGKKCSQISLTHVHCHQHLQESWNLTSLVIFTTESWQMPLESLKTHQPILWFWLFPVPKAFFIWEAKVHPRTWLSLNVEMFICLFGKLMMREVTEKKVLNRDKYLASYPHLSYFLLEVFPKLKNKKEHLFWRWATHFFPSSNSKHDE